MLAEYERGEAGDVRSGEAVAAHAHLAAVPGGDEGAVREADALLARKGAVRP